MYSHGRGRTELPLSFSEQIMGAVKSPVAAQANGTSHVDTAARKPMTVPDFVAAKSQGKRLTMLTVYDYSMARLLDAAGVDSLLIGDSVGMVVQGHNTSLPVTLDEIIYHTRCVARGTTHSLIVADLPFMSYQVSPQQAVENAGRLLKEGGAHAVKLEGGVRSAAAIAAIVAADIPVMAHIGMTPQSVNLLGGFRVQRAEDRLLEDAAAVEKAGAFAVVVECVPAELARKVTEALHVPTIGIGAGPHCDGQVLVTPDILGLYGDLRPKFVKLYADLGKQVKGAVEQYCHEVRDGTYPGPEHSFR
jgi:3-methyl-2-oxobutanoate hydroxymethyltransferase